MAGERFRVKPWRPEYTPSLQQEWSIETRSFTELVDALKAGLRSEGYSVGVKSPRSRGLASKIYGVKRLGEEHRVRPVILLIGLVALGEAATVLGAAAGFYSPRFISGLLDLNPLAVNALLSVLLGLEGSEKTWFMLLFPLFLLLLWPILHGRGGVVKHVEDLVAGMVFLGFMAWARHYTLFVQESVFGFYLTAVVEFFSAIVFSSLAKEKIYYASLVEVDVFEKNGGWVERRAPRSVKIVLKTLLATVEIASRGVLEVSPVESMLSREDLEVLPEKREQPRLVRKIESREKIRREERLVEMYSRVKNEYNRLKTLIGGVVEDYSE